VLAAAYADDSSDSCRVVRARGRARRSSRSRGGVILPALTKHAPDEAKQILDDPCGGSRVASYDRRRIELNGNTRRTTSVARRRVECCSIRGTRPCIHGPKQAHHCGPRLCSLGRVDGSASPTARTMQKEGSRLDAAVSRYEGSAESTGRSRVDVAVASRSLMREHRNPSSQ